MRDFLTDQLVPFAGVVLTVAALTLALFDVPADAPAAVFGLRVAATAEPAPSASPAERARIDDTLTRVLRSLDNGQRDEPPRAAPTIEPARAPTAVATATAAPAPVMTAAAQAPPVPSPVPTVPSDPKLLGAVTALTDAVRAIHDARTEEDLVRAEDLVRNARTQMESGCATGGGPLCASADQIRSLGF